MIIKYSNILTQIFVNSLLNFKCQKNKPFYITVQFWTINYYSSGFPVCMNVSYKVNYYYAVTQMIWCHLQTEYLPSRK